MSARITASLGLETTAFQAGLDRANTMLSRWKQTMKAGDVGGSIRNLFGGGAMIAAFRGTINAAQEARDKAKELGRSIDENTAAAARYADKWDLIKQNIAGAAIAGLGFLNRIGENIGSKIGNALYGTDGDKQFAATRRLSEPGAIAGDMAKGIPEATLRRIHGDAAFEVGRARREEDQRKAAVEDEKTMKELASGFNGALEAREKLRIADLTTTEKIAQLEAARAQHLATYNNQQAGALTRARAFGSAVEAEVALARERTEVEKERTAEIARQAELRERAAASEKKIADAQAVRDKAAGNLTAARADRQRQLDDALGFTVADAATGNRGNSSSRALARRIQQAEAAALRRHDFGGTVTEFDAKTQRNVNLSAADYQARALSLRKTPGAGFTSAEANPFAAADESLKQAGNDLKAAAAELKNVTIEYTD